MKLYIVIFLSLLSIASVASEKSDAIDLKSLEFANPNDDFKQAVKQRDLRFIGLMGYSIYFPGIRDCFSDYRKTYGYKIVNGTSDVIYSYEQGRLTAIANYYAETYNRILSIYIDKNGLKKDGNKCKTEELH